MAETNIRRFYHRGDFLGLAPGIPINAALISTQLGELAALSAPVVNVEGLSIGEGILVEWEVLPSAADLLAVDAVISAFTGGETTSEPFVITSDAATTNNTGTAVDKLDITTPPLDAGTYQIIFSCQYRMTAAVAGEAARAISIVTASPAAGVSQQDHWGESVVKAYNGAATIKRTAGQTIRVQLQIAEVGPGAGTAEMSKARITIDKIG